MKSRSIGELFWILTMAIVVILMLVASRSLPRDVQVTPVLIGYVTLAFFLILVVLHLVPTIVGGTSPAPKRSPMSGGTSDSANEIPWPPVLRVMSYIVVFWFLVLFFGLVLIPPLFITIFLIAEARVRALIAIGAALFTCTVLITGLTLLNVELWLGLVDEIIPGVLGGSILPDI